MQISNMAYMGVESMVRLAVFGENTPCTMQGLAVWLNHSESYTEILMARLHAAGLVKISYGPGGGCYIARPAHRITVAEIFQALNEPSSLLKRPLNEITFEPEEYGDLHGTDLLWESLKRNILLFLNGISLADIVQERIYSFANDETESHPDFQTSMHSMAKH